MQRADARPDSGFTLLEMVCVMAVVALLAAMAVPRPHSGTSRAGVEQLARRAASMLKADRYAAIRQRATITTNVNVKAREVLSGSGKAGLRLPDDVSISATVSTSCNASKDSAGIRFYADGRSCGGSLTFSRDSASFEVRVNWLTGGVEIVAAPVS